MNVDERFAIASTAHSSYVYRPFASGRSIVRVPASTWARVTRTSSPLMKRTFTLAGSETVSVPRARPPAPETETPLIVGGALSAGPPPGGGTPGVGVGVGV